tara:strand:- start:2413 stop:3210 length:798 start_codon:yes stop_codon:yes gene_type:complete
MLGTYYYHEILRKTIVAFGTIFNDIHVRHTSDDSGTISDIKVPLAYAPQQKFLARLEQQAQLNKPVAITLPRMSFELTGIAYDSTRKSNVTKTFKAVDGENMKKVFLPVPYNVEFQLSIYSKLNEDALQIIEQILPYFQPAFKVSVDLVSSIGEKRDIPISLNGITMQDEYEGNFQTRRALIYTLTFTANTYLFGPISDTTDGLIRKVQVDYYTQTDQDVAKREMRYTAVPDPIDADPGDDFGFSETLEMFSDSKTFNPASGTDT